MSHLAVDYGLDYLGDGLLLAHLGHLGVHHGAQSGLLGGLDALLGDAHGLHADEVSVLGADIDDVVGLGPLAASEPPNVITGQVLADEHGVRIEPVDVLNFELELNVHLREVAVYVVDGCLGGPADQVSGIGAGGFAQLGLVEHAGSVDLVPLLGLPPVLDLP